MPRYQCHVSSVPILASLRDGTVNRRFYALGIAGASCAVAYTLAANYGYLTFGDLVNDDLLLSYDAEHRGDKFVSNLIHL